MSTGAVDPVELLRSLLRFDTSNPPGNERPLLEFVAELLRDAGLEPRFLARDPERPNLIVRLQGEGAAPPLLLYGHVDVVPAEPAEWRHPPFAGELADGEVWGRGALDMKNGVAMLVSAVLRTAGASSPPGDVILALTSDEEAGSELGAKFLVAEHSEEFAGVRHAISEFGGAPTWIAGRPLYPIQVAEKQACTIRAAIRGSGGHPSLRVPGTAVDKMGRFVARLARRRLPVHIPVTTRLMLNSIAEALPLTQRLLLPLLLNPALTNRVLGLLGEDGRSLDPLLHNTATATVVRGGEKSNVIPTEVSVELDGRVLPGQTPADLLFELEAFAPEVDDFELMREEPAVPADPDLSLLPLLAGIVREREPQASAFPLLLPGYTDARCFSRLGIQTYGFLPLRTPRGFPAEQLIHAPDERVPADAIRFGVDCVEEAIRRYHG